MSTAKEIKRLAPCITAHAWNADGTKLALCPNNNEIRIYSKQGGNFNLEHTLTEHDQVVTGIDWAPKSNRIVSCSQDRNAYVWSFENNKWNPILVILRINRAATHVKWSPEENKFAVAAGNKCVAVCYFEEDQNWWVSKHIKKHKSTVLHLDWHPNNVLIATGSSDWKARIFSAYIKGVDKSNPETPLGTKAFGEVLAEIDTPLGWVQSVKWSPNGHSIAFVAQDSTFYVTDISSGTPQTTTVRYSDLPFRDLLFLDDTHVVAVGHDCTPVLFKNAGGWKFERKIDEGSASGEGGGAGKGPTAMKMFQNKVDKGTTSTTETVLNTKHQNCITYAVAYKKSGGHVSQYSTTGLDGNLVIWDAPK